MRNYIRSDKRPKCTNWWVVPNTCRAANQPTSMRTQEIGEFIEAEKTKAWGCADCRRTLIKQFVGKQYSRCSRYRGAVRIGDQSDLTFQEVPSMACATQPNAQGPALRPKWYQELRCVGQKSPIAWKARKQAGRPYARKAGNDPVE